MKKWIALILALAMVFALTACGSSEPETTTAAPTEAVTEAPTTAAPATEAPTTAAPTTEAPTTEAPTTEAPTTEAPTTEAPTESGEPDTDKAAFYANFKETVGEFKFVGEDIRIVQTSEGVTMEMVTAKDMVKAAVGEYYAAMYVDDGKIFVQTFLPGEDGKESKEAWYSAEIPEGEDPLADMSDASTEDYVYEDDMILEYLETEEVNGVRYDKVRVTVDSEDAEEALFWFEEDTIKIWKLDMEQVDEDTGVLLTATMEFFENEGTHPAPVDPEKTTYENATMEFAMSMFGLLYGEIEIGD